MVRPTEAKQPHSETNIGRRSASATVPGLAVGGGGDIVTVPTDQQMVGRWQATAVRHDERSRGIAIMMPVATQTRTGIDHMRLMLYAALLLGSITTLTAAEFPFPDLPATLAATFEVTTRKTEEVNNRLLGYNIFHFTKPKEQDLIREFDPIVVRFPHGVWSNFYNWETDGYTRYSDTWKSGHAKTVEAYIKYNMRCGFPGLAALHKEKKERNGGRGYDMIWTYNLNYDSPQKSVARLKHSQSHGFDMRDIELSNEHFWKGQRSSATSTPEKFLQVAESVSAALKTEKPSLRLSIPISWRRNHAGYNRTIVGDGTHFDAISVHKYTGADEGGDPTELKQPVEINSAYRTILTARLKIEQDVNFARSFAPGKPVWMTEWGVSSGKTCRAAAALAMADSYLFLFENQNVYDRANWFSVNGLHLSFLIFKEKRQLQYPLRKTAYACVYEIVRGVFENSRMLQGQMHTTELTTDSGSLHAVSARAVTKDGETTVLAVNLTDRPCRFLLKFDDRTYSQPVVHEAMAFKELAEVVILDFEDTPLRPVKNGPGVIVLPPLSVNRISGIKGIAGDL